MLHKRNISFLACTKVELWDLIVCIAVKGEKFQSRAVTLTLVRQCPISNLSELFSYTTMYLNFMLLDQFRFELSCKNTHTYINTQTHTYRQTHRDSDELKSQLKSSAFKCKFKLSYNGRTTKVDTSMKLYWKLYAVITLIRRVSLI